ncbi:hypothetical protein ACIHFE_34270 [Streptomyces sp. NPDC052396]|uniref:hypothetical protein n=1 Tax=Streptomyces sp. NPDC052396 TaxID=3365689 RepID=UPI0037D2AC8A
MSLLDDADRVEFLFVLFCFRTGFFGCLTARTDALFEITDALLCADGLRRCDLKHTFWLFRQTLIR